MNGIITGERKLRPSDFEGRKVVGADVRACNQITLLFDDGKALTIEADLGPLGIPVMNACGCGDTSFAQARADRRKVP